MKNIHSRLLLVFIGLPLLFAAILLLDFLHFIGFNFIVILFSGLGAMEFSDIIRQKLYSISKPKAFLTGILLPIAAYISQFPSAPLLLPAIFLFVVLTFIFANEIFRRNEAEIGDCLKRVAAHSVITVYPGLFSAAMVYITSLSEPKLSIVLFLALVFTNDTLAFVSGMLFGKNNRNIFAVSPNKSMAGFIGGLLGCVGGAFIFSAIFPNYFLYPIAGPIIIGAAVSIFSNIGDLFESALKRSAGIKDSGTIIPGRGGVLDSIDSIIFTAPFFVFIFKIMHQAF